MVRKVRHLNILIAFMLFLQLAVYPASALGSETEGITVEKAVQIVKDNFSIPEKYTQLSTGYNEYNNRASYSLNWNTMEGPGGMFNAEVDAKTGEILSVNQWEDDFNSSFELPILSALEAEKIATGLVSKLAGKHQAEMQLVKDEQQVVTLNYMEPFMYNFRWVRILNGIQFPENGVNLSISGDGKVRNYNMNWTQDLVYPDASKVITPEKAYEVFTDTPMLELQYFIPQMMNPQTPEPQRVLLIYQLSNKYLGGAIDALTGESVTVDSAVGMGIYKSMSVTSSASSVTTPTATTSQIIKSTDPDTSENNQQISRDEAAAVVKKLVKIPKGLELRGSSLNPDWQNPNEQVWDLDWYSESSNWGEHNFLNARVNAETGDLVGFHMKSANSGDKSKSITRKAAQKIAENFLESVQPEHFKLVKEDSDIYGIGMPSEVQMFNYVRVVNGIPVSDNGMNIMVDAVGKQVVSYNKNWSDVEFPSPSNVIPLKQATEKFLKDSPLVLNYSLDYQLNGQENDNMKLRLVYRPDVNNGMYMSSMLDAITGDQVDWYGKSESQWIKAHYYTDILGNYAEKEIGIMGLTGAFGEYGETFRPDEKITVGSLLKAMLLAEGNGRERVLNDEDVIKMAKEQGWIHDDLKLESELSRLDLSKIMIRLINMEPSAQVKGIYVLPFTDALTIEPDSLGYIALTWGLGILKIDGDVLQPNQTVTRAEAAYALVHAYGAKLQDSHMK